MDAAHEQFQLLFLLADFLKVELHQLSELGSCVLQGLVAVILHNVAGKQQVEDIEVGRLVVPKLHQTVEDEEGVLLRKRALVCVSCKGGLGRCILVL